MKWNDFAVQIEDPQPVFQLGFVNLPSAKIKGIEGDFAFTLNEQWQLDGTFSRNNDGDGGRGIRRPWRSDAEEPDGIYTFAVEKGARLPLTPDWQRLARPGVPPEAPAVERRAVRALRLFVRRRLGQLAGGHRVGRSSGNPVEQPACLRDRRSALRAGGGQLERLALRRQSVGRARGAVTSSNRWNAQRLSVNRPRTIGIQFRYNF